MCKVNLFVDLWLKNSVTAFSTDVVAQHALSWHRDGFKSVPHTLRAMDGKVCGVPAYGVGSTMLRTKRDKRCMATLLGTSKRLGNDGNQKSEKACSHLHTLSLPAHTRCSHLHSLAHTLTLVLTHSLEHTCMYSLARLPSHAHTRSRTHASMHAHTYLHIYSSCCGIVEKGGRKLDECYFQVR